MKIIIANQHLTDFGGSELWTLTMSNALWDLGHDVTIFCENQGEFSRKYVPYPVISTPQAADLYIINHATCYRYFLNFSGKKIYTTHSSIKNLDLDRIPTWIVPDVHLIAVSQEVADIERNRGFKTKVILNPIDMQKFKQTRPVSKKLRRIFVATPSDNMSFGIIQRVCKRRGIEIISNKKKTFYVERLINKSDLVIAIGRCLVEAMACNRNVISADHRSWMTGFFGAGFITPDNIESLQSHFYSGRNNPVVMTEEQLERELDKYDPTIKLRSFIKKHHDYIKIAKQYLSL